MTSGRDQEGWIAATVLPNIALQEPIEGGLVALAPRDDARVKTLCRAHPNFRRFLGKFTDAFGEKLHPAVLLVHADAPPSIFNVDALASFRDAIALSVVPRSRAFQISHGVNHGINFSNSFWFYPWMLDRHNEDLIASTPGLLGVHEVAAFKGQSAPEIPARDLSTTDIDEPLLAALLVRWHRRYTSRRPAWADRALFRSLNMANQAALLPAGSDTTFYDVGRSIALWVSAFEILAHPGAGRSDLWAVYELFDGVEWQHRLSGVRRYKAHEAGRKGMGRRPVACWLYGEIYRARNDFLHGNPVAPGRLTVKAAGRSLFQYTAPLYRMALTGFLPLRWAEPIPSMDDPEALGRAIAERMEFGSYQKTIEKALLTARGKELPPRGQRRRRAESSRR